MFNAPEVITMIPDIQKIYDINDTQCEELEVAVETMDKNIFLDSMDEKTIKRWEEILEINPYDDDTLNDRRFRVKGKVMEKLPYSHRVIVHRLNTLAPDGYRMTINEKRDEMSVKLVIKSKKMIEDVRKLLEELLPLNIIFDVSILWNQYSTLSQFTYAQLSNRTYKDLREENLE